MKHHSKKNLESKELFLLKKHLKTFNEITEEQLIQIVAAMKHSSLQKLSEYKDREIQSVFWFGLKLLPKLRYDNFILWVRGIFFKLAKKEAILRANTENYKIYVIRGSNTKYKVLSTIDVQFNKQIKILGKDVTAKDLHKVADFVAYPKKLNYENN